MAGVMDDEDRASGRCATGWIGPGSDEHDKIPNTQEGDAHNDIVNRMMSIRTTARSTRSRHAHNDHQQ